MAYDSRVGLSPGQGDMTARMAMASRAVADRARLRQMFAGEEQQLAHVRRWLASLLPSGTMRDDLASIATELGSNAIRHSASGRGGTFTVEIIFSTPSVRVAVTDAGSHTEPRVTQDPDAEEGHGLLLVRGLSASMGVTGDRGGRTVWAEVAWPSTDDQP
jgi:two-component sensor histidine kinase